MRSIVALFVLSIAASLNAQEQQSANLGDFKLESGEVLRDCRIGYRTFGQLNADKSNATSFLHGREGPPSSWRETSAPAGSRTAPNIT